VLINISDHLRKNNLLGQDHKGIVVDNKDPRRLSRVKVSIPGLIESTDPAALPWAIIKSPTSMGGRGDLSSRHIPEINSEVIVRFPYNDPYMPVVEGYWQSSTTTQGYLDEDYPNTYGFRDVQNTHLRINKVKKILEFVHASGAEFKIQKDSLIEVKSSKGIRFISEDGRTEIFFDLDLGNMELISRTKTTIGGPELDIINDKVKLQVGQIKEEISGAKETEVLGGLKTVVGGSQSYSVLGDRGDVVGGDVSSLIAGKTVNSFGKDVKETIALGANYLKKLFAGNHKIQIMGIGNIEEETLTGNITAKTTAGDITHKTSLGDVSLETTAGSALLKNALGKVELDIAGNVNISGLIAELKATATMKVAGTALTTVGSGSSPTIVDGAIVSLGGGFTPVARLGDLTLGTGNLGIPVIGTILLGSTKVFSA
jgi:hypothetical protein